MKIPQLPDGYTAERIEEVRSVPDPLLSELHDFAAARYTERRPGEPYQPLSETLTRTRQIPTDFEIRVWLVRDETGRIGGQLRTEVERTGDNEHMCWADVTVGADHRRLGIGRWLLARAAEEANSAGCTTLGAWSESTSLAGKAFAEALEFEAKQLFRESELDLTTLDWVMVDRWVAEGPERAEGYELQLVEGVYPEEHYPMVIAWWETMNTAPRDDLSLNDDHLTPERLSRMEDLFRSSDVERWEFVARKVDTGEFAGVTNVFLKPWCPAVIDQDATGVHPDHRGHALGKWLKAAMLQKIRADWPEGRKIRTGNAYSNDAMLGINNQLGFRESQAEYIWELPVEKALKLLS